MNGIGSMEKKIGNPTGSTTYLQIGKTHYVYSKEIPDTTYPYTKEVRLFK